MEIGESNLKDYVRLLLSHKYFIISFLIVFFFIGLGFYFTEVPFYSAEVKLVIDSEKLDTAFDVMQIQEPEVIMASIKNYNVILDCVKELNLTNYPMTLPLERRARNFINVLLDPNYVVKELTLNDYYLFYASNIVSSFKRGKIIQIRISTHDPIISEKFANLLGNKIVEKNKELKRKKIAVTVNYIDTQLSVIRTALESNLEGYHGLIASEEYINVVSFQEKIESNKEIILSMEKELESLRAEESTIFYKDGLNDNSVNARLDLNRRIEALKERVIELRAEIISYQSDFFKLNKTIYYEANELNYFVKQDELIYSNLINEKQKFLLSEVLELDDVTFLSKAWVPAYPDFTRGFILLMVSMIFGFCASVGLILVINFFETRFLSEDEIESELGFKIIGKIPFIPKKLLDSFISGNKVIPPELLESYETIRTNLHFARKEKNIKSISLVSSTAHEGSSLVAANLAMTLARDGEKTLLVDVNFRNPVIDKIFDIDEDEGGITNINKKLNFNKLCHKENKNLHVIVLGNQKCHPQNLMESKQFDSFLKKVMKKYDNVIFDASPELSTTETSVLTSKTDSTILVVDLKNTKKYDVKKEIGDLTDAHATIIGIVVNQARVRSVDLRI